MYNSHASFWSALHVRSRHEKTVHAQLQAKDHDSFLPLYDTRKRWADRYKTVSMPLFPGYVFCRFHPGTRHSILGTSGVIDIVRNGSEPAAIDTAEIEAVRLVVSSQATAEPYPHLLRGQKVIMTQGPLLGLMGTLANIRNVTRLVVSVEILCRSVLVEIDRDWVVACSPLHASPSPGLIKH